MLNPFDLEMQMLEHAREAERNANGTRWSQVPLMDWLLGALTLSLLFSF
ncbi:hypothetical protein O9H85_06540 [Paenibacillus filicis]|uniref:Uncharacterized protein n=1 Tax=Paenibacillus gyeongsangnamensis TaxID=3388067 RepID=A0ABT4Q5E5_9BACL|nr:hypothetical protein [Paenibacillus filicis]MCZ8512088.1 hypothetical protein [Paenibacillus filicis]